MALSINYQPASAIRGDELVHGMTVRQLFLQFNGSGTYSSGGLSLTAKQLGFKGAIICCVAVSGQTSGGATQDCDMHWDYETLGTGSTSGKLKLFLPNGTEITTQFDSGGGVRATFIGV